MTEQLKLNDSVIANFINDINDDYAKLSLANSVLYEKVGHMKETAQNRHLVNDKGVRRELDLMEADLRSLDNFMMDIKKILMSADEIERCDILLQKAVKKTKTGMAYHFYMKNKKDVKTWRWLYAGSEYDGLFGSLNVIVSSTFKTHRYDWPDGSGLLFSEARFEFGFQRQDFNNRGVLRAIDSTQGVRGFDPTHVFPSIVANAFRRQDPMALEVGR